MKIKIIANNPPNNDFGYADITQYIGNEYEVTEDYIFEFDTAGNEAKGVYIKELDMEIYNGEFEVIN